MTFSTLAPMSTLLNMSRNSRRSGCVGMGALLDREAHHPQAVLTVLQIPGRDREARRGTLPETDAQGVQPRREIGAEAQGEAVADLLSLAPALDRIGAAHRRVVQVAPEA